jgi:hypothetical protein
MSPQWQDVLVGSSGPVCQSHRLRRLARLRWRYYDPPPQERDYFNLFGGNSQPLSHASPLPLMTFLQIR